MATAPEGIMALGQSPEAGGPPTPAMPTLNRGDFYDISRQALKTARPDLDMELEENLQRLRSQLDKVPEKLLQVLFEFFQAMLDRPEEYQEALQVLGKKFPKIAKLLPKEFDEEAIAGIAFVLEDAVRSRRAPGEASVEGIEAMVPQQFARGGIAEAVKLVASQGRRGDTMLAHINPQEAALLKSIGGSGTINPNTGLYEYGFFSDFFSDPLGTIGDVIGGAVDIVGDVIGGAIDLVKENPIARVAATVALAYYLGPQSFAVFSTKAGAAAAAAGTISAVTGGSLKDIALSSLTAYIGAPGGPVDSIIGKYAPAFITSNPYVRAAVSGGISGTASGLIQGQSLSDSLRSGLTEGAISAGLTLASGGNTADAAKNAADATSTKTIADAVPANPSAVTPLELDQLKVDANKVAALNFDQVQAVQAAQIDNDALVYGMAKGDITPAGAKLIQDAELASAPRPDIVTKPNQVVTQGPLLSVDEKIYTTPRNIPYSLDVVNAQDITPNTAAVLPGQGGYYEPNAFQQALSQDELLKKAAISRDTTGILPAATDIGPLSTTGQAPVTTAGAEVPAGGIGSLKKAPTVMESLEKIGKGDVWEGTKDLFAPGAGPTDLDIVRSPEYKKLISENIPPDVALKSIKDSYETPFLREYGPITAAGVAGLALAGGFKPPEPPKTREQQEYEDRMRMSTTEYMEKDPSRYYIQNIPGVKYDERGKVIGTGQYTPAYTVADITGGNYSPYSSSIPSAPLPSAFMSPYGEQYLNQGGIATLAGGGYPRRTGQISGPGTETSDSIPAMLSDGEFVMTARAVRGMGNGSRREGARKMYALMHKLENNAARG